jgi:hypothetical protein
MKTSIIGEDLLQSKEKRFVKQLNWKERGVWQPNVELTASSSQHKLLC